MTYQEAISYLNSFLNYERVVAYRYPEAFSLDRIARLLHRLGNPERAFPALHVAGTKGKGSTCAFAASILKASGLKVGLYSSPHLLSFRERFQVNGVPVSEAALAGLVGRIRPFASPELTFFEITTACAFLHFAQEGAEAAVIEVGLGGRLDATNVLEPEVTAITPISLDHMSKLGHTVREIAGEKAGIIKRDTPVVIAAQPEEAARLFEAAAIERRAPLHRVEEEVRQEGISLTPHGSEASFRTPAGIYPGLRIPLLGRHQLMNAATAVRMVELWAQPRGALSPVAVREGLAGTRWPGRCQLLEGSPPILLDGAQNAASARALKETVEELFPGRRVCLVVGVSLDKDLAGIAQELGPWAERLILTRADLPRAESPRILAEAFRPWHPEPLIAGSVAQALDQAREISDPAGLLIVTGSLFVAGEALQVLTGPSAAVEAGKAFHR